jgi:hypothetical protein
MSPQKLPGAWGWSVTYQQGELISYFEDREEGSEGFSLFRQQIDGRIGRSVAQIENA